MITVELIVLGNLKERFLNDGCNEYIKRLGRYCKIKITELSECAIGDRPSDREIEICLKKEADQINKKLSAGSKKIVLCIEGIQKSSEQLASYIKNEAVGGVSHIQLIVGSSHGLSEKIKKTADLKLSISQMTFPHQLMRLILLEQIYRAFSINANSKYHK